MSATDRGNTTDIFLLRVWSDEREGAEERSEKAPSDMGNLHGRLLHLTTGTAHNFDDWYDLLSVLQGMLSPSTQEMGKEKYRR